MEGLGEFNDTARRILYNEIQNYICTDLMPWVFIGSSNGVSVHSANVTDLQRNAIGKFYVFLLSWYGDEATWDSEVYCGPNYEPYIYIPDYTNTEKDLNFFVIIVFIGISAVIISVAYLIVISIFRYKKS